MGTQDLFIELVSAGRFENMRNAQRLSPSAELPYNVPIAGSAVPGTVVITSDFRRPHFLYENMQGGVTTLTEPIPWFTADPSGITSGSQGNWAPGDPGQGIDTNFTDAADRTWYYALGWESEALAQIGQTDGTLQPTGRLMEFGWDAVSTWKSVVLSQASALQKITITVPNLSASQPPSTPGMGTPRLTLWKTKSLPTNANDRRSAAMSYVGEVAATGGNIVDGLSLANMLVRQYFPANLVNAVASRGVCRYGKRFVFFGNGIGGQSREFTSTSCRSMGNTTPKVRSGAATNLLVLRRDNDASNKPYDPRVMVVTDAVISGGGTILTVTVENYNYLTDGQQVYLDSITGITGASGLFTVSNCTNTTFQITGTFTGAYVEAGEATLSVFTIPDWWIGLKIAVSGQNGIFQIIRSYTEGGTVTGIEIYPALPASLSVNATFEIYGEQSVRISQSDPRFLDKCPAGDTVFVSGRLSGQISAGIESPDGNGTYVYSRQSGVFITNIAREVPFQGSLIPASASLAPAIQDTPLAYGCAGINAIAPGPDGTILLYNAELGPIQQSGSSQRLLDPQQLYAEYYRVLRYVQTDAGVQDVTQRVSVAYNQNQNCAWFCLPGQAQLFRYDFRTETLVVDNVFAQKVQALATISIDAPLAFDGESYVPDANANVGDCTMFCNDFGDVMEWNPSFFVDMAKYYDTGDTISAEQFSGTVESVNAESVTCTAASAEFTEKLCKQIAMITDTSLTYDQGPGAVTDIALSGAPDAGRYATITTEAGMNITIGAFVFLRGVGGIAGINSGGPSVEPTYWRVTGVSAPNNFTIDSGANGTFTGAYTSGGRVYALPFAMRHGSYRLIDDTENSGGGTLWFGNELQWTAGAPLVGDIVTVQPVIARYESTDIRMGEMSMIAGIDRFAMDDESTTGYAVQFRVVPSENGFTPIESAGISTAYSSLQTGLSRRYELARTAGGHSVRVRVTWAQPPDGITRLNSFTVCANGMDGPVAKQIGVFPGSGTRANRQFVAPPDLNLTRDADKVALAPRGGSRVLSVFLQSRPFQDGGSGGASTTEVLDNVCLVLRVGGQPSVMVSTRSARFAYEGFENGTTKIIPVLSLGTIRAAVPEATY